MWTSQNCDGNNKSPMNSSHDKKNCSPQIEILKHQLSFKDWVDDNSEMSSSDNDDELMTSSSKESVSEDDESMAEEKKPSTPKHQIIGQHGGLDFDAEPCTPPSQILRSVKGFRDPPPTP
jgi:hypothetical protein